jgi:hypothetical protein
MLDGPRHRNVLTRVGERGDQQMISASASAIGPATAANTPTRWSARTCELTGVDGLRVADASIMPCIVCVNTNPATIMIGEKAADTIRSTHS